MKMKICNVCGEFKNIDQFYKSKSCKNGYMPICKLCRNKKYSKNLYNLTPNKYIHLDNGITKILITSPKYGVKECLIDSDDFDKVTSYNGWWISYDKTINNFYVITEKKTDIKRIKYRIHRVITNCPQGKIIDHINHNTLDNRKYNLRITDDQHNQFNSRKKGNWTSDFKGVSWNKYSKKWIAQIQKNGKNFNLGIYDLETDAALAYNKKARNIFGENCYLNEV